MKPKAVIFDIDGTLAIMGDRSPYNWRKVGIDTVNERVADLSVFFRKQDYEILIFSGRLTNCRTITEEWLGENDISYKELHMRPERDRRKDVEVKREFYEDCSQRYDIHYAVDDRLQVCRLWHELGLCLLRVGDPDADF